MEQKTLGAKLMKRMDGWANTFTKFGVKGKDKMLETTVTWEAPNETDLEHVYSHDDISRKVVDLLPAEAFREGVEFKKDEKADQKVLDNFIEEVKEKLVFQKNEKAWKWGRLYGGSTIFLAVDDGKDLSDPLDIGSIRKVNALNVLNRFELNPETIEKDLNSPLFGMPTTYSLSTKDDSKQQTEQIHHTRLIRFDGAELPRLNFITNNRWHDSILTAMAGPIRDYNIATGSAARLVQDFSVTLMKLKGLADLLQSTEGKTTLTERLEIMNMSKSILGTMVVDAEDESVEMIAQNVTGLFQLLDKVTNRMVAATGIPATVLLGISPSGGLSGKGESENRDWYDTVAHKRERVLRPGMSKIFTIMQLAKQGSTGGKLIAGFDWSFNPLRQMDDKEKAEIRKTMAEADKVYIENMVLDADEVAKSRFGGEFSLDTVIDFEERERLAKLEPEEEPDDKPDDDEGNPKKKEKPEEE